MTNKRYTPDNITELAPNEIFVFGSNTPGRHGKGAALTAVQKFGAKNGVGDGMQGRSYGIPTKGYNMRGRLSVQQIRYHVDRFIVFASTRPDLTFLVTEIGCGLAGHKVTDIAPLFEDAPSNVVLPKRFADVIDGKTEVT